MVPYGFKIPRFNSFFLDKIATVGTNLTTSEMTAILTTHFLPAAVSACSLGPVALSVIAANVYMLAIVLDIVLCRFYSNNKTPESHNNVYN